MLPEKITKKELTGLLDISNTKLQELEKLGIITKNSTGSYDLSNVTDFVLYERYKIPEVVRLGELASFLGYTERWIQQKTEDGIIVRVRKGEYEFIKSVKNYIESLDAVYDEIETEDGVVRGVDLKKKELEEKIKLLEKRNEKEEIKLRKMRGEIYESADVENVWAKALEIFRDKLLNIAPRLAPKLKGEDDSDYIENTIEGEITDALEELSNINPEEYKSKDLVDDEEEEEYEELNITEILE